MADEDDEKTRLIRRQKTTPEAKPSDAGMNEPTRVLEPEDADNEMTKLVGPARRSGAPEPALIAFCSFVYSSVLVPAFTSSTSTFG